MHTQTDRRDAPDDRNVLNRNELRASHGNVLRLIDPYESRAWTRAMPACAPAGSAPRCAPRRSGLGLRRAGRAVALLLLANSFATAAEESRLDEQALLAGAQARIIEHRMGEVVLKLVPPAGQGLKPGTRVLIEQQRHAFLFGCNIYSLGKCRSPEDNAAYEKHFAELFNFATLAFYWWSYEQTQGKPQYADTDRILAWCKAHGITPKGHPLAWNFVDPKWLPDDPAAVIDLQLKRVGECVNRFRGDIAIWDVVNEATHYDREEVRKQAPKLTAAIERMGLPPFLHASFRIARAAHPQATLIINDYRLDEDFATRVVEPLADHQGRPLYDVIGLQSHQHGGAIPLAKVWAVCERFAKFGKPLHWTETTFLSGEQGWDLRKQRPSFDWVSTPEGEKRQAEDAARFYTLLFSHPAVEAITWWDFSDQNSWQAAPAGLLCVDMTPKPAYRALHDLVKKQWWTREERTLGTDGAGSPGGRESERVNADELRVHGFFGDYRVTVTGEAGPLSGSFSLRRGQQGPVSVTLK